MTSTAGHSDPEEMEPGADETGAAGIPPQATSEEGPAEQREPDPRAEVERWKDVAARAQADLDNFRKRMAREKAEAILYANRGLLEQLLPIVDNFEMGLKAAGAAEGAAAVILQGMGMVHRQIVELLADQGVETIEPDGLAFDPNLHEAIKQEPNDTVPEGHVICTMRRGYRLKDRVLRAATVVVSSGRTETV